MPEQTTTAITGCDLDIEVDDDAGAPVNVSGSTNAVAMNFDKEIGMLRTFKAGGWPVRQECGKDAEFRITAVYSSAEDEAMDLFKKWWFDETTPRKRTVSIYVPKKNVGADVYRGEFRIKSLPITIQSGSADPIAVEVALLPDGEVQLLTNAT